MRLVDNWRAVLARSWAVRVAALHTVVNIADPVVGGITSLVPSPPLWLTLANAGLGIAVIIVRIIDQEI